MTDIITSSNNDYKAKQDFFFLQVNFVLGVIVPIIKSDSDKK